MLTIDKLFHYAGGQILGKGFNIIGLDVSQNALISGLIMTGKELTDSVFCLWDLGFGVAGWIVTVL